MIEFTLDCCLWYFFLLWLNYNSVHSGNVSSEDVTGRFNSTFEQVTNHLGVKIDDTFTTKTMQESEKLSYLKQYKKLFKEHRLMQIDAIKSLTKFHKTEDQYRMVKVMLTHLFKNLQDANINLTRWGYVTGDDEFSANLTIRETVSNVLENTALFGDLLLHLPQPVHQLFSSNWEWNMLMRWAVNFSNLSRVFEASDAKLLSMVGQESGLIAKSHDAALHTLLPKGHTNVVTNSPMTRRTNKKIVRRGPRLAHFEL